MGGGLTGETLGPRALNRALLARQGLLERTAAPVPDVVARLCGLQAQVPSNPYVALWARIAGFRPAELSDLLEARALARAQTLRATIHLHTADDLRALQPLTGDVLARVFRGQFRRLLGDVATEDVAALGRSLLTGEPRSRAELAPELAARWPQVDTNALAQAVTFNSALVQATPRGLWGRSGAARWARTEEWLGAPLDPEPSVDAWVLRYLAAFGPATSADVRTWSGLTGLRAVLARLRPRLRAFRDAAGRELLDVEDGALPDPDTPAPPRFLPEYDNVVLAHADRARIASPAGPGQPWPSGTWIGTLYVDGFFRAYWRAELDGAAATLTVDRLTPLRTDPGGTAAAIEAEGVALLALIAPGAEPRVVL